ncbi:MAG TPA: type II toxin-antitoxin system RelE/ParE family toxin [Candidatus Kapabacteria bacterium]|nr:type II toxin-antitoxin system RelE/ParE family toxin [Candidatus Kapabacteria bacterium]
MSYSVIIKRSAEKELERLDDTIHDRIIESIIGLKEEPRPRGCEKLKGQENYRIRIGEFRVVYAIDDKTRIVEIIKIADRKEIYKKR